MKKLKEDYISDHQDSLRTREKYYVNLPDKQGVQIKPQKASTNNMSPTEQQAWKEEIQQLLERKLIEPCKSSWACPAFDVNKHSEQKRGTKRLVLNYEVLNDALEPIRYPLPNKELLFSKIAKANVFNKFSLKSGFWKIGIAP